MRTQCVFNVIPELTLPNNWGVKWSVGWSGGLRSIGPVAPKLRTPRASKMGVGMGVGMALDHAIPCPKALLLLTLKV